MLRMSQNTVFIRWCKTALLIQILIVDLRVPVKETGPNDTS